jgi:hypothetical protein
LAKRALKIPQAAKATQNLILRVVMLSFLREINLVKADRPN